MFGHKILLSLMLLPVLGTAVPLNARQGGQSDNSINSFTRLIVFGDSYSDNGNGSWIVSNKTWPADPAYYEHHFSNGPTWAFDMAENLGVELLDRAVGGATTDNDFVHGYTGYYSNISVPSTKDQISTFLNETNNTIHKSDIVTLYIGTNDVLFNLSITAWDVLELITGQISTLHAAGAQTILLASYPVVNILPAETMGSVSSQMTLIEYSYNFTAGLNLLAAAWSPLIDIAVVDVQGLFEELYTNPEEYGLNASYVNPSVACLNGTYPDSGPRTLCDDVDEYVFFDIYHPTTRVHEMIAQRFQDALGVAVNRTNT